MKKQYHIQRLTTTLGLASVLLVGCGSSGGTLIPPVPQGPLPPFSLALLSQALDGGLPNGRSESIRARASNADGRFVVFESSASNLVAGDGNGTTDVFVRDRVQGITTRVSVNNSGQEGNFTSADGAINEDGTLVVFRSFATNLDAGARTGLFARNLTTGVTEFLVPTGNGFFGREFSVSGDGRFITFSSSASDLVPGDANGSTDVFLYDRLDNGLRIISVDSAGNLGNGNSQRPHLSRDGRFVVFDSTASNLVAGDNNGQSDIFLYEVSSRTTSRVSLGTGGVEADLSSFAPTISADGSLIGFESGATNLVNGDTNGNSDLFVRQRVNGTNERISLDGNGQQLVGGLSRQLDVTNGRFCVFVTTEELIAEDTNPREDVYVRDLTTGQLRVVSVSESGAPIDGDSLDPSISSDGRNVVFESAAQDILPQINTFELRVYSAPNPFLI